MIDKFMKLRQSYLQTKTRDIPTFRERLRPIIAEVINEVGKENQKALKKALSDAFPYKDKRSHSYLYKVWRDEINRQLGKKRKKIKGQLSLFKE